MAESWQEAWVAVLPDFSGFKSKADREIVSTLGAAGDAGAGRFKTSFFGQVFGGNFLANLASNAVSNIIDTVSKGIQSGIQFSFDGIQLASDLAETISAVEVIFGDSSDAIVAWSKTAVQRIGQTQAQALGGIKTFGALGKAAGLTGPDLEGFSTRLVDLAADMASFNNTDVDTALTALRSGLSGESEPLRQYQVFLNDAALKQKALELGIYDGTGALDDQQRILAAYNVILEKTSLQQGDFARTQDGVAQQQKILNAALEQAQTTLGSYLLPGFTAAVTYINTDVLPKFGELIDRVGPKLAAAFQEAGPDIADLGDDILGFLGEVTDDLANGGIDDLTDLLTDLVRFGGEIKDAWAWANDPDAQPAAFLNGLVDAMNGLGEGGGLVGRTLDQVTSELDYWSGKAVDSGEEAGALYVSGVAVGITSGTDEVGAASDYLSKYGIGAAASNTSGWVAAGQQAGDGLAAGIASKRGPVGLAAKGIADEAVKAIRTALKIKSPSKVMAELGSYAAEGFSLGWADSRPIMTPGVSIPSVGSGVASSGGTLGFMDPEERRILRDLAARVVELNVDSQTVARASISGSAQLTALGAN